jgi:hypothetical protein
LASGLIYISRFDRPKVDFTEFFASMYVAVKVGLVELFSKCFQPPIASMRSVVKFSKNISTPKQL